MHIFIHHTKTPMVKLLGGTLLLLVIVLFAETGLSQQSLYPRGANLTDDTPFPFIRPLPTGIGFAFLGEGTTGGEGGQEVTVTNGEELLRFASSHQPYIINVVDTIEIVRGIGSYVESNGEYHIGSNTTLRGIGANATILYGGFRVQGVENVIIQNLHFDGTYRGFRSDLENISCEDVPEGWHRYNHGPCLQPGDKAPTDKAIDITEGSERVWITQNSFRRYSDDVMSVKRESSFVTLSWNRYDDPVTGKNGMMLLIGHSDNHTPDIGRLKTTIHHNYFASRDRQPRIRFGQIHILNNYYADPHNIFNYGAAAQRDSEVAIEGNYYHNVGNRPWRFDINSFQGYVDQRNNTFVNTTIAQTRGSFGVEIFEPADVYDYDVDNPDDIPGIVLASVGAGNWDYTTGEMPVPGLSYHNYPEFSATVNPRPDFDWTPALFADSYQIQVGRSVIFSGDDDVVIDTVVTETAYLSDVSLDPEEAFFWRVRAINGKGPSAWSSPTIFFTSTASSLTHAGNFPTRFKLDGNYPNPFNPVTNIQYSLPEAATVDLRVYDVLGREVASLLNRQQQQPGIHTVQFDALRNNLASGVYIYRIMAIPAGASSRDVYIENRTMTLVK
jgi:pectate lyase